MRAIEKLLSNFFPKKRRRKEEILPLVGKVTKMVEYSETEAKKKALELLDIVFSVHRETKFADFESDTQMLGSNKILLSEQKAEERDIQEIKSNLFKAYLRKLHDEILHFVEINKDTYIDFEDVPAILKNTEEIVEDKFAQISDYQDMIQKMSRTLRELRSNKSKLKKQGSRTFSRWLTLIYTLVIAAFGTTAIFKGSSISELPAYFILTVLMTYLLFEKIYKWWFIVGNLEIFREHNYYEE